MGIIVPLKKSSKRIRAGNPPNFYSDSHSYEESAEKSGLLRLYTDCGIWNHKNNDPSPQSKLRIRILVHKLAD